jgi:hypothetical protein
LGGAGKDKHPEKRLKAAYAEYEERNMPLVKADNPTLKLSQLRELIWKVGTCPPPPSQVSLL